MRRVFVTLMVAAALGMAAMATASADLLSRLIVGAEKAGSRATRAGGALEDAAALLRKIPADVKGPALAADVGAEGHWSFVNRAGDRFTASGPEEMKRVLGLLAPEAAADAAPVIVLTENVAFRHPGFLKDLPKPAVLRIAVGGESYPLIRRTVAASERLYAEVKPKVIVELSDRRMFDEALFQLARPLERSRVRVLALEPGGPHILSPLPKLDPSSRRPLPDRVDPDKLGSALSSLSGQTVVITGRIEAGALHYRLPSGSEQRIVLQDVLDAAERSEVGLIVLQSSAPRQPGTRNWLWLRVDVDGLDKALERSRVSDFLDALTSGQGRLVIEARERSGARTSLRAIPVNDEGSSLSGLGGLWTDVASEVAGRVLTSAIEADLSSADRQRELDMRIIPGIPSSIQLGYIGLMLAGLIGVGVALSWWTKIWPPEQRSAYAGMAGYYAAWLLRVLVFAFLFMPAVAVVSAPLACLMAARDALTSTFAILTWPLRTLWRTRGT